jgi:hypothetical protein
MLKEIMTDYSENNKRHVSKLYGENTVCIILQHVVRVITNVFLGKTT